MDAPSKSPIAKPPPLPKTEPPKFEPRPMPKAEGKPFAGAPLQRKCACSACSDCDKKKPMQRAPAGPAPLAAVPPSVTASMEASSGAPLPEALRETMESRFGRSFESVRVFTDAHAAAAAKNANARAFTTGDRIYFAEGAYQPDSESGRELIAHELTHVVQQQSGRATASGIGASDDAFEHEAERAAKAIVRGERPAVATNDGARSIRRQVTKDKMHEMATAPVTVPLDLPALKTSPKDAGRLEQIYTKAAGTRALRTTHAGRSKDEGTSTETLWHKWASTRPLTFFDGGVKNDAAETKLIAGRKKAGCQVDHVLELQVGGADDPNNMRLLDGKRNMKAGSQIAGQIRTLYSNKTMMQGIGVPAGEDKPIIEFSSAKLDGGPAEDKECLDFEIDVGKGGPLTGPDGAETIETEVSGNPASIFVADEKVLKENRHAVPSFELGKAVKAGKPLWQVEGALSENLRRIPVLKPEKSYTFNVDAAKAAIKLVNANLKAEFPNLSETTLQMRIENRDLIAEGILKPSHPLFQYIDVALRIEKEKLSATAQISPDKLKKALPIPGLDFTDVNLILGFGKKEFTAAGGFGIKYTTIAVGRVEAKFGDKGFEATGGLNLNIPGLTEAKGQVWYREKKLGGKVDIGARQLKVPGIKEAKLQVLIGDGMLSGTGTIDLGVPGVKKAELSFLIDPKGNFAVTGKAAIKVPGLKEGEVQLAYSEKDKDLTGLAKLALAVPGLDSATFDILYAKGMLSGKGEIAYKKGKLSGKVRAELTPKHKFLGGGELAYEIFPGVAAAVGVQIEDEKTIVSGEVRVPETFELFAVREYNKKLFSFGLQIPIFAIPLGPKSVGLVAEIGADISARAGIGPGQLRGVKAKATIDLSKEDNAFAFNAAAELYVPAYAYLRLAVHGGLGLSIAIASATGGIELAALLGLQGALAVPVQIDYKNGIFVVDAAAEITAQPVLKFDISAYVKVELDLWITTVEVYRKDWMLASREWGSGLVVGLRFPVHFESGKPFALSLDQVQFIRPEIDVMRAVKDLLPI
ncbi:MAG: hypothetical protein QOE82_1520 [Thermoanaerobaculia bacterium]|jgi:hypothetical protein|nr:hypothetical protein [Thermoanaerobaculia bacterium]